MKTLLAGFFCLLACSCLASRFPTEEELSSRLHRDMTVEQVTAVFGEPASQIGERLGSCLFRYIAPIGSLTVEHEGYIGFEIHLVDGRVRDWHTYRANPSYAPMKAPAELKWIFKFWWIILVGAIIYGLTRAFKRGLSEVDGLLTAYERRDIPARRLPVEFRFISKDTTLQEVIEKVGPYSRASKMVVDPKRASGFGFIEGPLGGPAILLVEYTLPYQAAVILMPEYPFESENRIRAVFYRPPREDDDLS